MKKIIAGAALALSALAAQAAGVYDGIYQLSGSSTTYASVHTAGTGIIIAIFDTMPSSGIRVATPSGSLVPTRIDYWDLINGTIIGNRATVSGQRAFGGCTVAFSIDFSATAAVATVTGAAQTSTGAAQSLNCAAETPVFHQFTYTKVL